MRHFKAIRPPVDLRWIVFSSIVFLSIGCLTIENKFTSLPPGMWRGILLLDGENETPAGDDREVENRAFEEVTEGELPFQFEVGYDQNEKIFIEIINGEERIRVEDIQFGRDRTRARDTLRINFPVYDSYITGYFQERFIKGKWVVNYRENYAVPFKAEFGRDYRFTQLKKTPLLDLTGKWEVTFGLNEEEPYKAIGEFVHTGNRLVGTFLTETGDHRFLEGTVQDNKLYLSCFDGSHAYLYEGKINPDSTLTGIYRSGIHYRTLWEAKRNPSFQLVHPDSLTFLNDQSAPFNFSFENPEGQLVSLSDETYNGKIKIIQVLGTWCPNCLDETKYLMEYLQKNPSNDLKIIGLAFERYREKEKAMAAIQRYKTKLNVDYEILLAGYMNKKEAAERLPMLNKIVSYPTMIILDRKNRVRKIHTGFNGPATSQFVNFQRDFEGLIRSMLAEE